MVKERLRSKRDYSQREITVKERLHSKRDYSQRETTVKLVLSDLPREQSNMVT